MQIIKSLFVQPRFFYSFGGIVVLFLISFGFPSLFYVGVFLLFIGFLLVVFDIFRLFAVAKPIIAQRITPKVFSLGNNNLVKINVKNLLNQKISVEVLDEIPFQFQKRNFIIHKTFEPLEKKMISYEVKPLERGVYDFGDILFFLASPLQLFQRKIVIAAHQEVPTYPSLIDMKEYDLFTSNKVSSMQGKKRLRRLGNNNEFDHIKQYNTGDDPRTINWKASSRRGNIMVNKYEDEKSQNVYSILDLSRSMYTPFNGMSLVDYAINTSLAISNIILKKQDKVGLISFSKDIHTFIKANNKPNHIHTVLHSLYKEKASFQEANYEKLYFFIRKNVKRRSLILLYTNFESTYALERNIGILRKINKLHLLVVVFFINEEIEQYSKKKFESTEDLYFQTAAGRFVYEKKKVFKTIQQYGIQTVLTTPKELSINTINKYLQIKSKGAI